MSYFKTGFHTTYSKSKLPEMNSPYLLCGFPGSGYVGKFTVDYLIKELNAIHLADIYSSELPPQVTIRDDGNVDLMKNILYYKKGETNGVDLLFLTGDAQPINGNSEYILAEENLENCKPTSYIKDNYTRRVHYWIIHRKSARLRSCHE